MDLGATLSGFTTVDLVIVLFVMGFFVLGFAQGTIRRLIGIASILFSFLFAANVAEPLGTYLGQNWTQYPPEYSKMLGFGTVFVAAAVAFALVAQGFYKSQPLFQNARFVDELIGGVLGIVQAFLIIGAIYVILDSYFRVQGVPVGNAEIKFLRDTWNGLDGARSAALFRDSIIPGFFAITGFLVPDSIEGLYRRP